MSDPNGADETVVTIEVEHVEGVISLPDMISRIDERANARRQRHGQCAPERDADRRPDHARTASASADRSEKGEKQE